MLICLGSLVMRISRPCFGIRPFAMLLKCENGVASPAVPQLYYHIECRAGPGGAQVIPSADPSDVRRSGWLWHSLATMHALDK